MTSPSRRCAKMWNGSEMRQLLPYMPGSRRDIITPAALLWLNSTDNDNYGGGKLKPRPRKWCSAPVLTPPPSLFPTSASLSAPPSPPVQPWPIYLCCIWSVPVQTCWCTGVPLALQQPLKKKGGKKKKKRLLTSKHAFTMLVDIKN